MPSTRKLPAVFYRSESGDEPVREWLKALDIVDRKTIGEGIAYVQYKWPIGKPRVDHLRGSVWEVRSKLGTELHEFCSPLKGLK
jgi:hypothetical protein